MRLLLRFHRFGRTHINLNPAIQLNLNKFFIRTHIIVRPAAKRCRPGTVEVLWGCPVPPHAHPGGYEQMFVNRLAGIIRDSTAAVLHGLVSPDGLPQHTTRASLTWYCFSICRTCSLLSSCDGASGRSSPHQPNPVENKNVPQYVCRNDPALLFVEERPGAAFPLIYKCPTVAVGGADPPARGSPRP